MKRLKVQITSTYKIPFKISWYLFLIIFLALVYNLIFSFNLNNWSKKLEISLNLVVWFFLQRGTLKRTVVRSWLLYANLSWSLHQSHFPEISLKHHSQLLTSTHFLDYLHPHDQTTQSTITPDLRSFYLWRSSYATYHYSNILMIMVTWKSCKLR